MLVIVHKKPTIKVKSKPPIASIESYSAELLKIYQQAKNEVKNGKN